MLYFRNRNRSDSKYCIRVKYKHYYERGECFMKGLDVLKKYSGVILAGMSAVAAFTSAIADQKKENKMKELIDKVDKLGKE